MDGFGQFLKDIFEWLYGFWPFRIVLQGEQGVRYKTGVIQHPALTHENGWFKTGFHFFRPYFDVIITRDTNVEVEELAWQNLRFKDGEEAVVAFSHRYRVEDLSMLYSQVVSGSDSIVDASRTAIAIASWAHCEGIDDVATVLTGKDGEGAKEARRQMRGWGVKLIEMNVISWTTAQSLRLIMDSLGGGASDPEE
jgi:regulator of protease activity HflC (stomatin/prohibitin superfamily)